MISGIRAKPMRSQKEYLHHVDVSSSFSYSSSVFGVCVCEGWIQFGEDSRSVFHACS